MSHSINKCIPVVLLASSVSAFAGSLTLSSHDISQGEFMVDAQVFNGFGCSVLPGSFFRNNP